MTLKLGELCAGYGGLGMAVEVVFGAETAWFSEFDAAPSKILAHHWPDVPNYGDMTKIDWAAIEPVDIISGGTPCQDLSAAGRRAGMNEGTRSNLWVQMREAIAIQRPTYVVWENVRGAYSAEAASDLEHCPGCMGDPADRGAVLRALGRVLGDLSDLGYDTQWRGLRAADVGGCHGRFRVFVLAVDSGRIGGREGNLPARIGAKGADRATVSHGPNPRHPRSEHCGEVTRADIFNGIWCACEVVPNAMRGGSGGRSAESRPTRRHYEVVGSGTRGSWARLAAANAERVRSERRGIHGDLAGAAGSGKADGGEREWHGDAANDSQSVNWGGYEPAIRRWEVELGRPAPRPTEPTGRNQGHRLSPRFTEWMMGLPDGWVTDPAIRISRNEQLKACGNGVVPQQAMAALRDMLAAFNTERKAA